MDLTVDITQILDSPGVWTVEAIGQDGEIYQAIFAGPTSEIRAREYASLKYGLNCEPLHQPV